MPKLNTAQLVAFIKSHALTHYNAGWDVVVETMTDEELAERLEGVTLQKGAIAAFPGVVGAFNEQCQARRNRLGRGVSVAHNMTGLGSTRSVQ
jgi:hypothetical protein